MEKVKNFRAKGFGKIKNFCKGIGGRIKSPSFSIPKSDQVKQLLLFPFRHKFLFGGTVFSVALILFMAAAIYRGYFLTSANTAQNTNQSAAIGSVNKTIASNTSKPTLANPSPSDNPSPSESTVLGDSSDSSSDSDSSQSTEVSVSPAPAISPVPTDVPEPTETPTTTDTSSSSSGNSSCTTAAGVPNSWYSDVYPNPPVSTNTGSVTLSVNIRDCNINNVSSSSTLKISLNSGDPNTQVNGQSLPTTITTQNGQTSFTVSSQIDGTVSLTVDDTTDSFDVTDTSNNNPSISFSGSSTSSSPTQTPTPTSNQSLSPTPTTQPNVSPTPTP